MLKLLVYGKNIFNLTRIWLKERRKPINQLYKSRYIREVIINNGNILEILKYISGGHHYISYGIPNTCNKEITEWKDLLHEMRYVPEFEGYKDRKSRLWVHVDYTDKNYNTCQKKVYKSQFVSAKSYLKIDIVNPKDIRMKELVNELNAEEFITYLKDNGIGELHIK